MKIYTLRNLRFPARPDFSLAAETSRKLGLPASAIQIQRIVRKALDTRRRGQPVYDFTLQLSFSAEVPPSKDLTPFEPLPEAIHAPIPATDLHPFIIGMGPAGLFCALAMVANGLQPWLFDRGDALDKRAEKVTEFWRRGSLDKDSNVQCGEGGAGAWSDGKLTSRGSDPALQQVFDQLLRFGAPPETAFEALPHLGSDGIRALVHKLRTHLLEQGCRFFYRHSLEDLEVRAGKVSRVQINSSWHSPQMVVLALGNAARETWRQLKHRGVELEPKPFALGFRIEQAQDRINTLVYGEGPWPEFLGPASYRLTAKTGFTFCMCPGGQVIAAASEQGGVVTNGMSFAARAGRWANSAVVTPVNSDDYGDGLWSGVELQRQLEKLSFREAFLAPVQSARAFMGGEADTEAPGSTYLPGVFPADLNAIFPPQISSRLRSALIRFDQVLPGFSQNAVLTAPETRTSSPIRILRDKEKLNCAGIYNLYPVGEGSGYAGGIVSSAADGWRLGQRVRPGN
ncbi:MAG: hypothetical protein LHW57_04035 [Candidatus Cloacimonetes bacterium]|nr:hypothetical protein [Candidatus Cloacimonadota bacterium]